MSYWGLGDMIITTTTIVGSYTYTALHERLDSSISFEMSPWMFLIS